MGERNDAVGIGGAPERFSLIIGGPTAFAITLEQAGGVVVSDGPMLLVASVGS